MANRFINIEKFLEDVSHHPLPTDRNKPSFLMIVPASAQIPTPGREFFLKVPIEGVSYISTTLKNAGYKVEIIDYRINSKSVDFEKFFNNDRVVIGIATFADSYTFIEDLIKKIRDKKKDVCIILGGPFISSAPEILMRNLPVDYAILGEGELTILELMEVLSVGDKEEISKIPGIAYKQNGSIIFTNHRRQIADLDYLPFLDLNLWPSIQNGSMVEKVGFSSTRGCYNSCSFCFKTIPLARKMSPAGFGKKVRYLVNKHNIKFAFINDLTFVIGRERTIQLCSELKSSGIRWACSTRVDNIDRELLEIMHDCGCEEIWYGIESVDQKVLDANFKKTTVEQIEEAVKLTNEAGIKFMANFIIGLLGETEVSLNKMIKFIDTHNVIPCSIKYLTPFPGTHIYNYARKKGLIKDEIGYFKSLSRRKVNYSEDEIINCTGISERTLRDAFKRIRKISYDRYGPLDWNIS
ncbi:MAG: hypothetical protein AMJ95_01230 [Omnitrophica WOR_2 bacterium SM23_72]|nr:MAG: hypothetical protein AMJ95_01230 [Omnitrophica WOR_2 bacterium SM23_72]